MHQKFRQILAIALILPMVLQVIYANPEESKKPAFPNQPTVSNRSVHPSQPSTYPPVQPLHAPTSPQIPVLPQNHNLPPSPSPEQLNPNIPSTHPNYPYTALLDNPNPLYSAEPFANRLSAPAGLAAISNANTNSPIVAVIDTGFALKHVDLTSRWYTNQNEEGATSVGSVQNCTNQAMSLDKRCNNYDNDGDGYNSNWRGWDFVNNDNDPVAGTTNSTGTAVAHGTLTASMAAVLNPNAKIMPLQALDDNGSGYTDTVAAAIRYAADHGANIISLSLGSTYDDAYLRSQIDYAIAKGVLVIAAAGNSGCDCLSYPAAYPEVLSVGATDASDNRASFSSYGNNLDVVAPGTAGDVCGAIWIAADPTSSYSCSYSGTSFATPITASLALLIKTQNPTASVSDIIRIITQNTDKVTGMDGQDRTNQYGYGRINVYKSLIAASLDTPKGQQINKTTLSLSSSDLVLGPDMDSTCQGAPGATCNIKITSQNGSIVKYLGSQVLDNYGGSSFAWNAASIGLMVGKWKVESILSDQGQTTIGPASYITVGP